jgi:DNA-binding HxlR family transcriptional regulator
VTGECPVAQTLRALGGKHGPHILHCLLGGEMHFLALARELDPISKRVLRAQLRDFETGGLVAREVKDDARRHVGYSLTGKGRALGEILSQLYDWNQRFEVTSP